VADWVSIKAEYITTDISTRALAEKSGVSYASLRRRAEKEHWADERKTTERKVSAKVAQKVARVKVAHETDRITRLLSVSDALLQKAERGVSELGEFYIVKRKVSRVQQVKDDAGNVLGIADIDETAEVATKGPAIVDGASVRHFAAAIKDLVAVATTPKTDEQSLSKVAEMMVRLDKEASADAVSKPEADGVST